jgi:hypothetical protein
MPKRSTDDEVSERPRRSTESLRSVLDRSKAERRRLEAAVNRLETKYRPSRRPDLRLIQGGRAEE